jgi:hypothetical protein
MRQRDDIHHTVDRDDSYEENGDYGASEDEHDEVAPDGGGRITPFRTVAALALAGSIFVTLYALFVERTAVQIPILVSGRAVLGITLLVLAVAGAARAVRAAEDARPAAAFFAALLGGLCALGAAGALGSAIVFALIWGSAR